MQLIAGEWDGVQRELRAVFFFARRRRHTRCSGDWSSDVCSSDPRPLTYHAARAMFTRANAALGANWTLHDLRHTAAYRMARDPDMPLTDVQWILGHAHLSTTQRSEERRVGKECRSRWSPYH